MSDVVEIKNHPPISEEEKTRRKENIDFALGSVMLEGYTPRPEIEELMQRYINGELTSEEFSEAGRAETYRYLNEQ